MANYYLSHPEEMKHESNSFHENNSNPSRFEEWTDDIRNKFHEFFGGKE